MTLKLHNRSLLCEKKNDRNMVTKFMESFLETGLRVGEVIFDDSDYSDLMTAYAALSHIAHCSFPTVQVVKCKRRVFMFNTTICGRVR